EGVDALIGCDVKVAPYGDERLKPADLTHRFRGAAAGEDNSASVCPEHAKLVAVFGADDPDDRICAAVGRGDDGGAASVRGGAPEDTERPLLSGSNFHDHEIPTGPTRAIDPRCLESDEHFIPCPDICRRCPDGGG